MIRRRLNLTATGSNDDVIWAGRVCDGHVACTAIRAGPEFSDWGVLDDNQRCSTCSSQFYSCKHVSVLPETAAQPSAARSTVTSATLTQQHSRYLDPVTGGPSITSISRASLPELLGDDPPLKLLVAGDSHIAPAIHGYLPKYQSVLCIGLSI